MNLLIDQAEQFYESLRHGDAYTDLRCVNVEQGILVNRSILKGWSNVRAWLVNHNGRGNCFIGRNPRNPEGIVTKITTFSFDLDPVGYDKTKGATDAEIKNCILAAESITKSITGSGYGFSGNGVLVYFAVDCSSSSNISTLEDSLRFLEREVRNKLNSKWGGLVHVDSTADSARMVKFLGSMSCKGARRSSRLFTLPRRSFGREEIHQIIQGFVGRQPSAATADGVAPISRYAGTNSSASFHGEARGTESSSQLIKQGQMHKPLVEFAGACRRRGMDEQAIYKQLCIFAEARCEKPISYTRLQQYAKSMMRYKPEEVILEDEVPGEIDETIYTLKDQFSDYKAQLESRARAPELATGFPLIDRLTWGLRKGNIFTVGAYTGNGKSTWCVNVAHNLCKAGKKVVYLSTELSYNMIFDKVLAIATNLPLISFERGLTTEEKTLIDKVYTEEVGKYDLVINDNVAPRIEGVQKIVEKTQPDVLIFDHIQQVGEGHAKRNELISVFLNNLLILARKYNFALLVVSQFKRPLTYLDYEEKKVISVKAPTLFDFKECAGIENKSRVAVLMYDRGDAVDLDQPVMTFEVAKNSFGRTGKVDMVFNKARGVFHELP